MNCFHRHNRISPAVMSLSPLSVSLNAFRDLLRIAHREGSGRLHMSITDHAAFTVETEHIARILEYADVMLREERERSLTAMRRNQIHMRESFTIRPCVKRQLTFDNLTEEWQKYADDLNKRTRRE